jgi:predicted TIM-barrel fold metal-dependent hydrolase
MRRPYRCISADTHLDGLPTRHHHRIPKEYRDLAPQLVRLPTGGDAIITEDFQLRLKNSAQYAGTPPDEYIPNFFGTSTYDESAPGWGSAEDRVRDMNLDGVDANVIYPSNFIVSLYDGTRLRDPKAYNALIRAYNDWMWEEYCAVAPDRLIGLALMPASGVEAAIAEMEHCARIGVKGIELSTFPSGRVNPTPEDDRFWAAALDLDMPVTIHGSVHKLRYPYAGDRFRFPLEPVMFDNHSRGENFIQRLAEGALNGGTDMVKLIVAGVFDRFPRLKIYWGENQIGWVPHYLEEMDHEYRAHGHWAEKLYGVELSRLPSEYVHEHAHWGFVHNRVGVEMRHKIGVDKLMWGNDFPHVRTEWPHSMEVIDDQFAGVPDDERYQMVCGNAIAYFHLEDSVEVPD